MCCSTVLPLSHQILTFVSRLIRVHRKYLEWLWRKLNPGRHALLVLMYWRKGEPFADVGAGFAVSTATY
ncbi:Helix-turn-helix of DDE superfamily endonuclease [Lentzea fradiae]|uniref:Helix-turn-helix of DDE superfamily endonuclease n=1 Tax=Lentzea fradiae TaxID=200378 RepID=A0A1G8DND5_9PSEU|nr:Helix-turn-helix of DDE superfamily endonuclease [Lentzea fradiae]